VWIFQVYARHGGELLTRCVIARNRADAVGAAVGAVKRFAPTARVTFRSERAKVMALATAMKCAETRQQLLLDTGILTREPSKMYQAILNIKQPESPQPGAGDTRSREEIIESMIEKLQKSAWRM
jgi:hypothetical protein